ncbi:erythromycin esterase family protein [Nocardiopsis sp. EMB25]|uniref:erythromycin esterase family protein n=1 Tax=Nocardiopsis sp. EMB25 TaxID=2835867 RepID=UPI002284AB7B|nr:erythromycin esterase family protein [Nocardiopsis sp. EMB25]MCY9783793.1 erythromycin esterase family protein [Nocardiopsis sp. EMB25]
MSSAVRPLGPPSGGSGLVSGLDAFLGSVRCRPRLLGLGEPTHGVEAFPRLRNRVLRHLVERWGYRSIAVESDCLAALAVDAYVRGGDGDLDEVLSTGFSHGYGEQAANRELLEWMRAYNGGREPADRVGFHGFDGPLEMSGAASPRTALAGLHAYLAAYVDPGRIPHGWENVDALLGDDGEWTEPAAMMDPGRSIGAGERARELRIVADDLAGLLWSEAPELVASGSREEYRRACLFGRTARGLLRYHAVMADSSVGQARRLGRLGGARDAMMADNLLALVRAERDRGPTLVFAHNQHLRRERAAMTMAGSQVGWWCAGAVAATTLGEEYAVIAADTGTAPWPGLEDPGPDTVRGVLREATEGEALFAADRVAAVLDGRGGATASDTARDYRYFPLGLADLGGVDAVAFLEDAASGTG